MTESHDRDFKGVWIPKEIWLNKDLTIQEKVMFAEINSLDGEKGCFASNNYFAEFFGLGVRRVIEIITSLKNKGLVTLDSFNGKIRVLKSSEQKFTAAVNKSSQQQCTKVHGSSEQKFTDIDKSIDKSIKKSIINSSAARSTIVANTAISSSVSGEKTISEGTQVNELINAFQHINTRYDQFFKHKTQRDSLQRLLKQFSFSQLQKAVNILPQTNGQPFAPVITSPAELEMKMSKLISFVKREKIKAETPNSKYRPIINVNKK